MHRHMRLPSRAGTIGAVTLALAAAVAAGCGSSNSNNSTPAASSSSKGGSAAATQLTAAMTAVKEARQHGMKGPDTTPRPAAKGKKIAIITISMANESGLVPAQAAQDAAKQLGWQARIYDVKGDIASITGLIRQALSTNPDGIVVNAVDCSLAKQAFGEAKAKGVPVVAVNAFDCNDAKANGGAGAPLFGAPVNTSGLTPDQYWSQNGSLTADATIADSGNKAKVILVEDRTLAGLQWMADSYEKTIDASKGSKIVDHVIFSPADFVSGKLVTLIQSSLTKHPEATYIKSPFTAATIAAIVPAVKTAGRSIKMVGGEGLGSEMSLIRAGTVTATSAISGEWLGWAADDTLNSAFRKEKPVDSGLQWVLVDKTNVPASGSFKSPADFKAAYRKAWGVG